MNLILRFLLPVTFLSTPLLAEKPEDEFQAGLREVWVEYEEGDHEAVTAKLRELIKHIEEKTADQVAEVMPAEIKPWKGESLKREDLTAVGGGFSVSKVYVDGEKQVEVKVVKDSPLIRPAIEMLNNKDLIALSQRQTHRISGETAVMDGDKKLQMALDGRIYLELVAKGEAKEQDLVTLARKLDLNALAKVK
ncbi:MAG: hypothetical protein AAGB14_12550 [Verrucomicrobiota bacterium]